MRRTKAASLNTTTAAIAIAIAITTATKTSTRNIRTSTRNDSIVGAMPVARPHPPAHRPLASISTQAVTETVPRPGAAVEIRFQAGATVFACPAVAVQPELEARAGDCAAGGFGDGLPERERGNEVGDLVDLEGAAALRLEVSSVFFGKGVSCYWGR